MEGSLPLLFPHFQQKTTSHKCSSLSKTKNLLAQNRHRPLKVQKQDVLSPEYGNSMALLSEAHLNSSTSLKGIEDIAISHTRPKGNSIKWLPTLPRVHNRPSKYRHHYPPHIRIHMDKIPMGVAASSAL